jgi:formimidoylglutamate deiminase
MAAVTQLHAPWAWVDGRWQPDVLLGIDASGHWSEVSANQALPAGAVQLPGPVLPGLVNAHSHAFQRAFAGLTERSDGPQTCREASGPPGGTNPLGSGPSRIPESGRDNFWSWRERMYALALRVTPAQLRAIATQLYAELLRGGYTQVCEFHYLHHREDGSAYDDELEMAWALADAAAEVGIGLTLLPVLYARSGFGAAGLRPEQRRFKTDAAWVWAAQQRLNAARRPLLNAGVALHSLRGASAQDIRALTDLVGGADLPIHIHIAEQTAEIEACVAHTGLRPMQWLCAEHALDARWQLVHATHSTPAEIAAVAASGAGVVICPSTEANLGDGLADLPGWLAAGVPMAIGSDSHATRSASEELRWLEYGQRLTLRQRNVAADPPAQSAPAARLFNAAVAAGGPAAGLASWGLVRGARADLLVLDPAADAQLGVSPMHRLDAWVFSADAASAVPREVWVAGRRVVAAGRVVGPDAQAPWGRDRAAAAFAEALAALS